VSSSLAVAVTAAPDLNAYLAGVELGLFAAFLAVSGLIVVATIRRIFSV
jgi:hypothetical protein